MKIMTAPVCVPDMSLIKSWLNTTIQCCNSETVSSKVIKQSFTALCYLQLLKKMYTSFHFPLFIFGVSFPHLCFFYLIEDAEGVSMFRTGGKISRVEKAANRNQIEHMINFV